MKIEILDKNQIINIYNSRMVNDFPRDELRPLKLILGPYKKGIYVCYGLFDNETDELLGYAFFVKNENDYLFDYLAIADGKRGSGIGTKFLELLREEFQCSDSVIGEVEDPVCAQNESDRENRKRRLYFYLSNGYIDTGVRVKLFGVDYIILEMDLGKKHDKDTITELYTSHYKKMLTKLLFKRMVCIKQNG